MAPAAAMPEAVLLIGAGSRLSGCTTGIRCKLGRRPLCDGFSHFVAALTHRILLGAPDVIPFSSRSRGGEGGGGGGGGGRYAIDADVSLDADRGERDGHVSACHSLVREVPCRSGSARPGAATCRTNLGLSPVRPRLRKRSGDGCVQRAAATCSPPPPTNGVMHRAMARRRGDGFFFATRPAIDAASSSHHRGGVLAGGAYHPTGIKHGSSPAIGKKHPSLCSPRGTVGSRRKVAVDVCCSRDFSRDTVPPLDARSASSPGSNDVIGRHANPGSSPGSVNGDEIPNGGKRCPVEELRRVMADVDVGKGVDAYIIPSEDPHQSEYSAASFRRRHFISGFDGTAGTAVLTADKAVLWTDGRYFLQAEKQLSSKWTLMRSGQSGVPSVNEWLRDNLPPRARVGIDPFLHSAQSAKEMSLVLSEKDISLVPLFDKNLVDVVWGEDQPPVPAAKLRIHPIEYAGVDVTTKIQNIQQQVKEANATAFVVTMLDEVAWLLNLRGDDVSHCPVAISYIIVDLERASIFVDKHKVTQEVAAHLSQAGVTVRPYEDLVPALRQLAASGARVWMDESQISAALAKAFDDGCEEFDKRAKAKAKRKGKSKVGKEEGQGDSSAGAVGFGGLGKIAANSTKMGPSVIYKTSPVLTAKAVKNDAELAGMRTAHLRDAAALVQFFSWLEDTVVGEKRQLTEVEVSVKLEEFRRQQKGFLDTSFDTIAGSGPNGAIIHYHAKEGSCGVVDTRQMFLLDSGAQYDCGTTDVTRTVHFGEPSGREKECFTRVLQGHIALDTAVFPEGVPGFVLDAYARRSLWQIGLDFRHGTGHGVGAALNVHEGPQGISPRFGNLTGLAVGMVVSNEPGYYEDGSFGIRIENLLAVREADTPNRFGGVTFLGFEKLTFVPIQKSLLELSLMNEEQIQWIDSYHNEVWEKVSPFVAGHALEWLRKATSPILNSQLQRANSSPVLQP